MEKYKVKIGIVYSQLIPLEPSTAIFEDLYELLAYDVQNSYFIKALSKNTYIQEQWDGQKHLFSKASGKFLTGHLPIVLDILESKSIPYETEDFRPKYGLNETLKLSNLTERPYQKEAVEAILKHKRGRIWARPRSGKTIIEIIAHSYLNLVPHISICQSIDIAYQTKEKFEKFIPQIPVGVVGDGQCDIKPDGVTIITIQSAAFAFGKNYILRKGERKELSLNTVEQRQDIKELIRDAKVVWIDEVHHVGGFGGVYQIVLRSINSAEYIIGVSGTLYREDNVDLYTEGLVGSLIYEISYSDLIKGGYLVAPTIHMIRLPQDIEPSNNSYSTVYKECIVENSTRNGIISRIVQNLIFRGKSSMILVSKLNHGKILNKLIPTSIFLQGNDESQFRVKTFQDLREKKLMCLITTLGDEGIDIENLDATIIVSGGKSAIKAFQRLRCLTKYKTETEEKTSAIVVDFIDPYKYLKSHSFKRRRLYKTESMFKVREKDARS